MCIKIYFEIFLVYKLPKSGNHLEKEPSAWTKGHAYRLGTCSMLGSDKSFHLILTTTLWHFLLMDQGSEASRGWLAQGHSARKREGKGWYLNPGCLKLHPECPPPPRNVYSWIPTYNERCRKASNLSRCRASQKPLWINTFIDQE